MEFQRVNAVVDGVYPTILVSEKYVADEVYMTDSVDFYREYSSR